MAPVRPRPHRPRQPRDPRDVHARDVRSHVPRRPAHDRPAALGHPRRLGGVRAHVDRARHRPDARPAGPSPARRGRRAPARLRPPGDARLPPRHRQRRDVGRAAQGEEALRHALVLDRVARLDLPQLPARQPPPSLRAQGHDERRHGRLLPPRHRRPLDHPRGRRGGVLHAADRGEVDALQPPALDHRLLGARVLLPPQRRPPLPLQPDRGLGPDDRDRVVDDADPPGVGVLRERVGHDARAVVEVGRPRQSRAQDDDARGRLVPDHLLPGPDPGAARDAGDGRTSATTTSVTRTRPCSRSS